MLVASPVGAAKEPDPAEKAVQALLKRAGELERAENCEGAFLKYQEAEGGLREVVDRTKAAQLEAIATNKQDKLEACYRACLPNDRQRDLLEKARGFSSNGEVKRATQVVKRMLVGKSEKCHFWGEARSFLRSLPKQAEEQDQDKVDPCEVTPEVQTALDEAKADLEKHRSALEAFEAKKGKLTGKLDGVVELLHAIDTTRVRVFELREEYLDCESVYGPLVGDAAELKDAQGRTEGLIITTYRSHVAGLAAKVRKFQKDLEDKDKQLKDATDELGKLKNELEELSAFNEEIYDDLFTIAGSESISFSTQVEGRRIEQPVEEIQALMADQAQVLKTLSVKYPEYFTDGVNVEGLKKKRFVLEKLEKMMEKFGGKGADQKLGYGRAIAESQATLKLIDKAIAAAVLEPSSSKGDAGGGSSLMLPLMAAGALALAGVGLLGFVVLRRRRELPPEE
ncbi:MAG: hypothetical protein HY901_19780 [Deltaproteobacteria bacterium]|nr:hypothetical protein [Deltaproteobacteria bacterium]